MAQGTGGGKRKRGDRNFSHDGREDTFRASPHRPQSLSLAQQNYPQQGQSQHIYSRDSSDQRGVGRRRGSRGSRGGGPQRSPVNSPNGVSAQSRTFSSPAKIVSPAGVMAQKPVETPQGIPSQLNAVTNTATTQTTTLNPSPSVYYYDYITEERLAAWVQSGKQDVINFGLQACKDKDALTLGIIYQELIRSYQDGYLDGAEAGSTIKSITQEEALVRGTSDSMIERDSFDAKSLFLDCLSIVTETTGASASLQPLVLATDISPHLMRCILDSTLLESLGMIRNTFVRVGIRQQTNVLYRQSNYNLLREETEGYSKLITELFTTSSSEPLTSEVVEETFEQVKGMIGAFDLDVGRVLDITLDVFAAVLVKQYRFFVKYLRASSWWPQATAFDNAVTNLSSSTLPKWALPGSAGRPVSDDEKDELCHAREERDKIFWRRAKEIGVAAFFEIGGRRAQKEALEAAMADGTVANPSELDEDRKWIEATGTLPPPGSKVAAQVLGFKLRFYSSSARNPTDVLPVNLIYLAALLIKVGFISLRDLYPHLWPADDAMEGVREEKMKEKAEKEKLNRPGGGTINALAAAGALIDDTQPVRLREAERLRELEVNKTNSLKAEAAQERLAVPPHSEEKEDLPEPADQKIQLLKSLLCIGALPESLYMLGRFPWLTDAIPDLPEHIHRILHHSLSKVYEPLRPLAHRAGLREPQKVPDPDQAGVVKGQIKLIDAPPRKILRWAQLDKDDTNDAIDYRFYWDDWADSIPVCQSVDDVVLLCHTLLNYTGVKIGQDPSLLLKLARIGSHSLGIDSSESNMARWIDLSKRLIVPALSLTKCNIGAVNEVFELIKNFSTNIRYSIYAEWYTGQISRLPDIKTAFDQARAETKDVLKRISKTNVKTMARALAKVTYGSPGVVFSVAIAQIESYDNLVETVVECARYFTYLGYDVLTWSLMSSLGGRGRTRVQADGMLTSRWLAALSLFAGKVFKRYSVMSPTPILQYVAEQLRQSNSTDLIVLEEIINSMAGIVSDTNFNESQVLSMAGGELLQSQTMLQLLDRRHESKTTSRRLLKSLVEPRLAGQILISIAQERQTCIFKIPEPDAHLKLLGNLFDELHRILTQYLDLLRSNLSYKEFDSLVPNVAQLINDYGIEPSVAFWISRPSITAAMAEYETLKQNHEPTKSPVNDVGRSTDPKVEKALEGEENPKDTIQGISSSEVGDMVSITATSVLGEHMEVEMNDAEGTSVIPPTSHPVKDIAQQPWHPVLRDVMDAIRPAVPEETWKIFSQPFYVTFWQLSLRDMLVPTQSYDDEITRQKRKILLINGDRTDISIAGTQRKEREKKLLTDLQDRLRAELKDQVQAYSQTRLRLQKEKEHWFSGLFGKWDALNNALIEQCFFPRILISPVDAMYSFKMLKFLHSSGATNFRTMSVLDQIFREKRLTSLLFLCTAKEAENFGRFLNEILRDLSRWHADKSVYEKEAFGPRKDLPGFSRKMTNEKTILSFLDYEEFRRQLLKWHRSLNTAIRACISSGEYMHIRNSINLLKAVHQYFPAVNWMGQGLVSSIMGLSKSETREDLKIAASSLLGNLKRREKEWVIPQAFHLTESGTNGSGGTLAGSTKPTVPQPRGNTPKMYNPKAAEFLSNQPSPLIGHSKPNRTVSGKLEVEDGEIEDPKHSDSTTKGAGPAATVQPDARAENNARGALTLPTFIKPIEDLTATRVQQDLGPPPSQLPPKPEMPPLRHAIKPTLPNSDTRPTPAPSSNDASTTNHPSIPTRPEPGIKTSISTVNDRIPYNLPNRPEPPSSKPEDQRIAERLGARDHGRDSRFIERGRPDRPGDALRDRVQEHSISGSYTRGYDQNPERPYMLDRNRLEHGWGEEKSLTNRPNSDDRHNGPRRDSRPPSRDGRAERSQRDRSFPEASHHLPRSEFQGQPTREPNMAPPRSNIPQHSNPPVATHHSDRRSESARYESFSTSERSSRVGSPARNEDRRSVRHEGRHDDRLMADSRHPSDASSHSQPLRYENSHLPTGPRTDRATASGPPSSSDKFRDSMNLTSTAIPAPNPNLGRLNQDLSHHLRQEESQYGRLNPGPEIPSGPRLTNGSNLPPPPRGGSAITPTLPRPSHQQSPHTLPPPLQIPDKQAPTGPSPRGVPRASAPYSRPEPTFSAPPTPVNESPDTASVHPDRLKAIQGLETTSLVDEPENQGSTRQPPPASLPPSGARGPAPSPVGPSPNARGPPTGPSFASDRNRGDKRFAGLQHVLQQVNVPNGVERSGQGASIRGRGGRANNVHVPSPSTPGPPLSSVVRPEPYPSRGDLFAGRTSGPSTPPNGDDGGYGRISRRGGIGEMAREGERRSERHRNNRTPSRERVSRPPASLRENEVAMRREDLRERMAGRPPMEREMRRPGREDMNRDRRGEFEHSEMNEWARDGRGPGRDERERERRDGGGNGRKRGRGGEEGPSEHNYADTKRPRRTH